MLSGINSGQRSILGCLCIWFVEDVNGSEHKKQRMCIINLKNRLNRWLNEKNKIKSC